MPLSIGDRVRVVAAANPYTGCRGTIAEPPSPVPLDGSNLPLGYYVAIDGENGRVRPFLSQELERIRAARVRRRPADADAAQEERGPGRT